MRIDEICISPILFVLFDNSLTFTWCDIGLSAHRQWRPLTRPVRSWFVSATLQDRTGPVMALPGLSDPV